DPIAPYHAERAAEGLAAPDAARVRSWTAHDFWTWRDTLFRRDRLGDRLFSFQPHLLVVLALAAPLLALSLRAELLVWLGVVLLGLHVHSIRHTSEGWALGFRNVRHAHVLVYPIVLLLAGLLCGLRARRGRWVDAVVAVLVGVGLWHSITTARQTRTAFADQRSACRLLTLMPVLPVYGDFQLGSWARLALKHPFHETASLPGTRVPEMASLHGYVVTGGAREPRYGCLECIPRA